MQLKDKVAIITGGGRGIGRAIATAYAAEGARVVIASRSTNQLDEVAAEMVKFSLPGLICESAQKWKIWFKKLLIGSDG